MEEKKKIIYKTPGKCSGAWEDFIPEDKERPSATVMITVTGEEKVSVQEASDGWYDVYIKNSQLTIELVKEALARINNTKPEMIEIREKGWF